MEAGLAAGDPRDEVLDAWLAKEALRFMYAADTMAEAARRSETFRSLWATHNVRWHTTGTKRFHHHVVGDLALAYEGLVLAGDPGQTLITFTAEAGSPSRQALQFLASWADVSEQTEADPLATEHRTT